MPQDARKMMIYLPRQQSERLQALAKKLDRPRSWVVQKALDLSYEQLEELPPQFPQKWQNKFMKNLAKLDQQTQKYSKAEIEDFAVQVVRDYRKKRNRSKRAKAGH